VVITVSEIAREYQVHPNQISQWKLQLVEHLPEVFESGPSAQLLDREKEIERLERKVGQLTMELDWLKKSPNNWACEGAGGTGARPRRRPVGASAVRVDGQIARSVLLRAATGERREPGAPAAVG
jgi:transposase-like protein